LFRIAQAGAQIEPARIGPVEQVQVGDEFLTAARSSAAVCEPGRWPPTRPGMR
jgi:hypothetical protein